MTNTVNRQWKLAARPEGKPKSSDFSFEEAPVPEPGDGEVVVAVSHISLDPAMRGWMNDQKSYIPPVELGAVMRAGAVGRVIASNHSRFPIDTWVTGAFGVQTHAVSDGSDIAIVDVTRAKPVTYLSALGMPGMTAYFGFLDVGLPKEGDTVVVSGGAGAVGALVGQIAKIKGCRVVGIAGSRKKCGYMIEQLGFDGAINYKTDNLYESLKEHCPKGIDIYFDNVGGETLDIVLAQIRRGARIVICGAISQYNNTDGIEGPENYLSLLINRARMEGFIVFDYKARYGEGVAAMAGWMKEGRLYTREHIVKGIDKFPEALEMLFTGENFGKLCLEV